MSKLTINDAIRQIDETTRELKELKTRDFPGMLQIIIDSLVQIKTKLNDQKENSQKGGETDLSKDISKSISDGAWFNSRLTIGSLDNNTLELIDAWVKNVKNKLEWADVYETSNKGKEVLRKNSAFRTKAITVFGVIFVLIAIAAAIAAVCGTGQNSTNGWAETLSSVLGSIDFMIGAIGFVVERISDEKGKQVNYSLDQMNNAIKDNDLGRAKTIMKECRAAIVSCNRQFNIFGRNKIDIPKDWPSDNSQCNIFGNNDISEYRNGNDDEDEEEDVERI